MIKGIGNDIIEIERIAKAAEKESFIKRWFTENEIVYFKEKNMRAETVAGSFSAKEAVAKAFGTGFSGFGAEEIEILRDKKGKPYVNLMGNALKKAKELGIDKIIISISHCREYASAVALCEGRAQNENGTCL